MKDMMLGRTEIKESCGQMGEKHIPVQCNIKDCLHYVAGQGNTCATFCSHPDKINYMNLNGRPCPLYRLDWQRKIVGAQHVKRPRR
jgi:hypothetical protein